MADTAAVVDAPAPASSAAPVEPPDTSARLKSASREDRDTWKRTGKLPDAKPAASSAAVEDLPATEPRKDKRATENRMPEVLADRAKERDRAERAERERDEWKAKAEAAARPLAAEPVKPAAQAKSEPTAIPTVDELMAQGKSYEDAITERAKCFMQAEAAEARANEDKERSAAQVREENVALAKSFNEKVSAAKSKHEDFEQVALKSPCLWMMKDAAGAMSVDPRMAAVDAYILEPENDGAEILYHLQKNPAEVERLQKLGPLQQVRALVKLEATLQEPAAKAAPVVPKAGPPPKVLGKQPAAEVDASRSALGRKDFRAFNRAELDKRIARRTH